MALAHGPVLFARVGNCQQNSRTVFFGFTTMQGGSVIGGKLCTWIFNPPECFAGLLVRTIWGLLQR
jgi:hypothetical protein